MRIFISYRRVDSQAITDRIYEWLSEAFGKDNVFQDVYGIRAGEDFREAIRQQVGSCDVLIVVIGQQWLHVTEPADDSASTTRRRLDNPSDSVRLEIEAGLSDRTKTLVIPVLVNDASFPSAGALPETMRGLTNLNAAQIRNNPYFEDDMRRLIARLKEYDRETSARGTNATKPRRPSVLISGVAVAFGVILAVVLITARQNQNSSQADETATGSATNETVVAQVNQTQTADGVNLRLTQTALVPPTDDLMATATAIAHAGETGAAVAQTHVAATMTAAQSATLVANLDATATRNAETGYFIGAWQPADESSNSSITGVTVSQGTDDMFTLDYRSYCPPAGNLCYRTESSYTISDARYSNGQVRGTLENTRITLTRGIEDGEIIASIRFGTGETSSITMQRERIIFTDDFSVVVTLQVNPNIFRLLPTPTP